MQIGYYKQKPKKVRSLYLTQENDNNTYIYVIVFSQVEEVTDDGIVISGMGIMLDYLGGATFVTIDLDYWEEITPEVFYLEAPNMLGKALKGRMEERIQIISN